MTWSSQENEKPKQFLSLKTMQKEKEIYRLIIIISSFQIYGNEANSSIPH